MEQHTYTTRRAAVAGARRVLERRGVQAPLSGVHFIVEDIGNQHTYKIMDLQSGRQEGEPEPQAAPEKVAVDTPAQAVSEALKEPPRTVSPPLSTRTPRWATPKEEKPAPKAYRPKSGTSQALIYDLLTVPEGMDIEAFCAEMNKTLKVGIAPWTPSNTWSCLRYLFCAGKGYGLRFDGHRLWLLVPKNEINTQTPTK